MKSFSLLLRELRYRKTNFALSLLAVTVATTLFVAGPTLIDGYRRDTDAELAQMEKQTTRLMRDMGFNLMIVHRDTNMADFWASDFSTMDMPQEYIQRLANTPELTLVTHLVATLQQKINWNGRSVLLVGYMPEMTQSHLRAKTPMGYRIEPAMVYLGHELGFGHEEGETIEVLGKPFQIARILPEQGSKEDIMIAMRLEDAQEILGKPGRVNHILALGCRCSGERLPQIRAQLERTLPETKITEFRSIAVARAEQRDLVAAERVKLIKRADALIAVTTPLILLACGVWVGLLAMTNVRERRGEIGLLRALGKGALHVATLFLGKAFLIGALGGLVGFALGTWLAKVLGSEVLELSSEHFAMGYHLLLLTLLGAPLLSVLASYLPTLSAVVQDPAVVLRDH